MPLAIPTRRMPAPSDVGTFLGDLLGRTVTATDAATVDLGDGDTTWVTGIFVEDDDTVSGAFLADLAAAAYLGAGLAMIPKPVADESIADAELSETLRENSGEVANIASALLNSPVFPHLRMTELVDGIPDEVRALVAKASGRRDLGVDIDDYGTGTIVLIAR